MISDSSNAFRKRVSQQIHPLEDCLMLLLSLPSGPVPLHPWTIIMHIKLIYKIILFPFNYTVLYIEKKSCSRIKYKTASFQNNHNSCSNIPTRQQNLSLLFTSKYWKMPFSSGKIQGSKSQVSLTYLYAKPITTH